MRAFFKAKGHEAYGIAVGTLYMLKQHCSGKLKLTDVKPMFVLTVVGNDVSAATSGGFDIYASHSGRFFAALGDTTGAGALVQTSITDVVGQAFCPV
jgi:hypothetical protein